MGSGSRNRLLSPLFGQITVWLPRYLGRFYPIYKQIFVIDGERIFTQFNALMHKIGSWQSYLSTQWAPDPAIGSYLRYLGR